jgi:hypothetical protein
MRICFTTEEESKVFAECALSMEFLMAGEAAINAEEDVIEW